MGHVTVSCIKHGKKDAKVTLLRTKKLKKLPVRASLYPYHWMDQSRLTRGQRWKSTTRQCSDTVHPGNFREGIHAFGIFNSLCHAGKVGDNIVMPHCHAWMVFLSHSMNFLPAVGLIENEFRWKSLTEMLNGLWVSYGDGGGGNNNIVREAFPAHGNGVGRPLREAWNLQGFHLAMGCVPVRWLEDNQINVEMWGKKLSSMTHNWVERILWLTMRVCGANHWIEYDSESMTFTIHSALKNGIVGSVSNCSGPSLRVRVRVQTEPLPN